MISTRRFFVMLSLFFLSTAVVATTAPNLRGGATAAADDDAVREGDLPPLLQQARIACSTIVETRRNSFDTCVQDIVLARNVGEAGKWDHVQEEEEEQEEMTSVATQLQQRHQQHQQRRRLSATQLARMACAPVLDQDAFESCVNDVTFTGNPKNVEMWIQ